MVVLAGCKRTCWLKLLLVGEEDSVYAAIWPRDETGKVSRRSTMSSYVDAEHSFSSALLLVLSQLIV